MKMAQKMVYCHVGHRYPFFSYSKSFTNIIFLVTLLQITMRGRHVTPAGHHYNHDGTGMDHMTTLAPIRDLFSKLITYVNMHSYIT